MLPYIAPAEGGHLSILLQIEITASEFQFLCFLRLFAAASNFNHFKSHRVFASQPFAGGSGVRPQE